MDAKNFRPGEVMLVDDRIPLPQIVEIQIEGDWVHVREADATGDAPVHTLPAHAVRWIEWDWPTGKP